MTEHTPPQAAAAPAAALHAFVGLAWASVLERVRDPRFAQTLVGFILLATLLVPGRDAAYATLSGAGFVALPTSALTGSSVAILLAVGLLWFGPFLTTGVVGADRATSVGELIAAAGTRPRWYVCAKFCANVALLGLLSLVVQATALLAFPLRGSGPLRVWDFAAPWLGICAVTVLVCAAAGVLWEVAQLDRVPGSQLLYFFAANLLLGGGFFLGPWADLSGVGALLRQAAQHAPGDAALAFGIVPRLPDQRELALPGLQWSPVLAASRALWCGVAGLLLAAAVAAWRDPFARPPAGGARRTPAPADPLPAPPVDLHVAPIGHAETRPQLAASVLADAWLLRPRSRWLAAAVAGIWLGALLLPLDLVRGGLHPAALLILIPLLAPLAAREDAAGLTHLIASLPAVSSRYILWKSASGLLTAGAVVGGVAIRYAVEAPHLAAALAAGSLFSAGWLICAARLRRSPLLGTLTLGLFWYLSCLNQVPAALDYAGVSRTPDQAPISSAYAASGLALLLLAQVVHRRPAHAALLWAWRRSQPAAHPPRP